MYNQQNYMQTLSDLLNIARLKIDEELDTITLNSLGRGYNYRSDNTGSWPNINQEKGGKNNAQMNRAGFDDNSQGERNRNYRSNNWNHIKKEIANIPLRTASIPTQTNMETNSLILMEVPFLEDLREEREVNLEIEMNTIRHWQELMLPMLTKTYCKIKQ